MPVLPRNKHGNATGAGRCSDGTTDILRLTGFSRVNPLHAPAADDLVHHSRAIREEAFPLAKGKLIASTEVENVSDIKVAVRVIALYPKTGDSRRSVADRASVE